MSKRPRVLRPKPAPKPRKKAQSESDDEYQIDLTELDESIEEEEKYVLEEDDTPVEYIPRKKRRAPVEKDNQTDDLNDVLHNQVKKDYGKNCEKLEAKILEDATVLGDFEKLRLLERLYGIKKLYKTEHKIADIKISGKLFVCAECGKKFTTRPGIKYHINGKCPEVASLHKCRLCDYQSGESFKIDSHIRLDHLKLQTESTPRKPAQTMSWLMSEQLLRTSYKYRKHPEPNATQLSSPILASDDTVLRKGWKFSNTVRVKTGKKLMTKNIEPRTSWETSDHAEHGYKFECNSGFHSIRCFTWLRAGQTDAFAISTPPFKINNSDLHFSSFLQFWYFPSSLISKKVHSPLHLLTKQCPFAINALIQVVDDKNDGYLAMACDDGIVRLIPIGIDPTNQQRFAVDSSHKELVLNGRSRSKPLSIDSFNDLIVAGYASGLAAVYKILAAQQTIKPLHVFDTHGLPISSICFHSFDHDIFTTSSFERITTIWSCTRGELYSTGDSPSHMILDSCWMQDMLALATDNVFQDHFGVVIYDPNFMDTRLKQRIGYSQPISSMDYAHLHGTLAIGDIDGRISLTSLPNPRKQMNMTRKGFQTIVISVASVSLLSDKKDENEFDVLFEDHKDLSKISEQTSLPTKRANLKTGAVPIDLSTLTNYSSVSWNTSGGRSCWLGFTSGSGIVRIQYIRGLTRESQTSTPLNPAQLEEKCASYR